MRTPTPSLPFAVDPQVLIVGAGGLGCPAALSLAQAGVRRMTVIDPDRVELSNLHRQPWPRTGDVGRAKVSCLVERLHAAFPGVTVAGHTLRLEAQNAPGLVAAHDVVIDATDDWRTKFLLSDTAVQAGVPMIYGGVLRMLGQAMTVRRDGACLRCLFEAPASLPTCAQSGVLGSLAGWVGAVQAALALEALGPRRLAIDAPAFHGASPSHPAQLRILDAHTLVARTVVVPRAPDCQHG